MRWQDSRVHLLCGGLALALTGNGCASKASLDAGTALPAGATVDTGLSALTTWGAMPIIADRTYRQFSSYDRDPASQFLSIAAGNKDWNNFLAVCGDLPAIFGQTDDGAPCDPGLSGYLLASDDGPGFVSRIFFTTSNFSSVLDNTPIVLHDETIRVFVDDLSTPAYEGKLADWRAGAPPFQAPLTAWTSGALVTYVPISYQTHLRVLLDNVDATSSVYFYQVDLQSAEGTLPFQPDALAAPLANAVTDLSAEARGTDFQMPWADTEEDLASGQTLAVLDQTGPGTMGVVKITVDDATPAILDAILLGLQWDDQEQAAVDLPLASLFGCRQGLATFDTLPMTVNTEGSRVTMTLSLPMPFAARARVTLTNQSAATTHVRAEVDGSGTLPPGEWGTLHATWQERGQPIGKGEQYAVADITGRGRYVGTMMFMEGRASTTDSLPDGFNFLEGDETFVIDGAATAPGTGTEDFFNGGWYFRDGRFDAPFASLVSASKNPSNTTGKVTALRWHVLSDAISFQSSFSLHFEYGANEPDTATDYSSVAFYYLQ